MSKTTEQLQQAFNEFLSENEKFEIKGNKAAGTRARKALQDLKNLAQTRRIEIQDSKNGN